MKKTIISFGILIILLCSLVSASATTEQVDLFHFDSSNPEIVAMLSGADSTIKLFAKWYLEKHYLPEGEAVDESKITYDLTKTHRTYKWNDEDISAFLKAEDKEAFLKALEAEYYSFPVYYDGVLLEDYTASLWYSKEEGRFFTDSFDQPSSRKTWSNYYIRKDRVEIALKELGIDGYEVLQTARTFDGLFFVFVQKGGQYFAVYTNRSGHASYGYTEFIERVEPELVKKRILNADEVNQLISRYDDFIKSLPEHDGTATAGQTSSTAEVEPLPPDFTLLWIIGGMVLLVGGIVTIVLVKKKKA